MYCTTTSLSSDLSWCDLAINGRAHFRLGYPKIVFELEAKPEFEVPRRRTGRAPAPAAHDIVQAGSGDAKGFGESSHSHAEWLQDTLQNRFSRIRRWYFSLGVRRLSGFPDLDAETFAEHAECGFELVEPGGVSATLLPS